MFSFIFGQLCDKKKKKLVHSSWWELEKRLCGLQVGWAEIIRQTVSFFVCMCVFVGWRVGGWVRKSGIKCCSTSKILENLIFHDYLHYLMKINHLSLRNDDAPVGFSYRLYRQEINGHFIYCDTKGFTWHSIFSNSLPTPTTQTPSKKITKIFT